MAMQLGNSEILVCPYLIKYLPCIVWVRNAKLTDQCYNWTLITYYNIMHENDPVLLVPVSLASAYASDLLLVVIILETYYEPC